MGNQVLLPRNMMRSIPREVSTLFTIPSYWNKLRKMPPITAHERKYGRKNTDCATRLNFSFITSLSKSAMTSGTNRRSTILLREITNVLRTTDQNVGSASISRKFCSPTHGEFSNDLSGVKS